jgi:hypothetical protein
MTARQPERTAPDGKPVAEPAPEVASASPNRYFLPIEPSERTPAEPNESAKPYGGRGDHYRDRLRRGHGPRRPR